MDNTSGVLWLQYLWAPIVGFLSWMMYIVWDTKADKEIVMERPTTDQVVAMIKIAVDTFAALDQQADEARIGPIAAELDQMKSQTLRMHQENREDMREQREELGKLRESINRLLQRQN